MGSSRDWDDVTKPTARSAFIVLRSSPAHRESKRIQAQLRQGSAESHSCALACFAGTNVSVLCTLLFWTVSSMTYSGMGDTPMPRAGKRVPRGIGFPADV